MQGSGSDAFKTTGRCFSVAAGRIAFTYALKGKSQIGTYVAAYYPCHTLISIDPASIISAAQASQIPGWRLAVHTI